MEKALKSKLEQEAEALALREFPGQDFYIENRYGFHGTFTCVVRSADVDNEWLAEIGQGNFGPMFRVRREEFTC